MAYYRSQRSVVYRALSVGAAALADAGLRVCITLYIPLYASIVEMFHATR